MSKYYILFNPKAGNGASATETKMLNDILKEDELFYFDMTAIKSYKEFFENVDEDVKLIISGGDGTLNRFVNDVEITDLPFEIYYFATGSGNDFLHDIGKTKGEGIVNITKYLQNLPIVTVNGKEYKFINAIGFGIDGYCCEVGDELRRKSDKPINYTSIAIKGLLFHFTPPNAEVTVDGKKYTYKKVWIAPTMNGRYYGGGMMTAPDQDRLNEEGSVSFASMYGKGRIKTLTVFPSIFKGEHIKHTDMVEIIKGHDITVKFDRPTALQVDGETIIDVTEYTVKAPKKARIVEEALV